MPLVERRGYFFGIDFDVLEGNGLSVLVRLHEEYFSNLHSFR